MTNSNKSYFQKLHRTEHQDVPPATTTTLKVNCQSRPFLDVSSLN
ncbi:MAG: hypothetical protein OXI87_04740 [Albidovulum sp.]|nr:hypothetical protein [Albidovulum sp.]MDE0533493.1 hypothetical protein [Albidovulum sp.]